jgi:prepilin-type N-terminal cleavage/methylation domain-containing protein
MRNRGSKELLASTKFSWIFRCGQNPKGLTLVELLIVMAIISIILSFSFISIRNGQARARDSQRAANLSQLKNSLNEYYRTIGGYPASPGTCVISSNEADHWISDRTNCLRSDFIVGLTPDFISALPKDPGPKLLDFGDGLNTRGLAYIHSTVNSRECFKVIQFAPENASDKKYKNIWDPARDGGSDNNILDGTNPTAWAVYSPGCAAK